MFEAHADIAIGADAKAIADGVLDTLDEPALKRSMASCHGLKTQVPGMSASGGRSTGGRQGAAEDHFEEPPSELQLQAQGPAHALEERAAGRWASAQCTDPLLGEELDMQASWFKLVTKRLQSLSNGQKIHMPEGRAQICA